MTLIRKSTISDGNSLVDELTGLANLRHFIDAIRCQVSARSGACAGFAVVIFDIDGFKPINDLFGAGVGDKILQHVAARLRRGADVVARIGADEFGVLLSDCADGEAVALRVRELVDILAQPYDLDLDVAHLTVSAGCSLYRQSEDSADGLFGKAEAALYQAKRSARGQVRLYSQEMEDADKQLTRIEQGLRRAIAADEVEPHFQPVVDLITRRVVGFEALARWTDPELGSLPPAVFIPIAEAHGFIGELSECVLRKATEAACRWPERFYLSFNLSPFQLADLKTAGQILDILDSTGFSPTRLEVEITETGLMTDPVSATKIIEELRSHGIRVSLDDFGTGQSSLGRLCDFSFDKLKIDRAFVASVLDDGPSEHILRAILAMCSGLGVDVIAEGIEEEAQAERLVEFGCTGGQGFLFGRAQDAQTTFCDLREGGQAYAAG